MSTADDTPESPAELASARARFERGDFLGAKEAIQQILSTHPEPPVETAARDLLARMAPDPRALLVGGLALATLIAVTAIYV